MLRNWVSAAVGRSMVGGVGRRRFWVLNGSASGSDASGMAASVELAELGKRFGVDMLRGVAELARIGYDATLFRRMLAEHGPVQAARRLVMAPDPSYGLWRLQSLNRLDVSVEMWILLPWYEPLFEQEVREQAERKLRMLGVDVQSELARIVTRLSAQ